MQGKERLKQNKNKSAPLASTSKERGNKRKNETAKNTKNKGLLQKK